MPKKEHVHIVTDLKHKEILGNLGKKFGSMTKAFEFAIENLEKNESFSSCNNCNIKFESEQANKFRELLNTVTFTADNIYELIRYLRGDCSIHELLIRSRDKANQFVKQYFSFLSVLPENTYENLLDTLEEYKKRTRLFKSIQVDKFEQKISARINIFEDFPIFVGVGLIGFLEALDFTFDIDIIQEDIILKWINPENYPLERNRIEEKIRLYIEKCERHFKSHLVKKGFLLITPQFIDWVGENLLNYEILPITVAYNFMNITFEELEQPRTAKEVVKLCENVLYKINFAEEIKSNYDNENCILSFNILCRTPNITKIVMQGFIIILGKWGWKLQRHRIDSSQLNLKFYHVGENDPSILEPLYINNFPAYFNQRFQKLQIIPVNQYNELTNWLYKLDQEKFKDVFRKQGIKLANAIRFLAKNDLKRMREIAIQVLPDALKLTHKDSKGIDILPENKKFTMIFKRTKLVEMEILRWLITGVVEGFGYSNIRTKILENIVTIEYNRPDEIDKVVLSIEETS